METFVEGAETRSLGQVLAAERERQGLARNDVAQRLRMSVSQVEALESGDYGRLPKGTFLRGFVRNYARLLHLEPDPLIALLPESAPAHKAAGNIVPPSEKIRFEPMGERAGPMLKAIFISMVLVALGFATLYWWFFMKDTPPAADARKPAATAAKAPSGAPQQVAAAPVPPAETPPPVEAPKDEAPAAGVTPPPPLVAAPAKAPGKGTTPTDVTKAARLESPKVEERPSPRPSSKGEGENQKRLVFRFSGESWVEIRDANGRTLMSKLHPAGSAAEVSGRAPFTVVVGNAPEVEMTYDDRPFDLQPHSRVGVARLTVQ